jgi:hypothetical protein
MEKTITVQVEYRNRRTFELKWMNPHELRVRVPLGTSRKTIDQLIHDKDTWIQRSRKRMMMRDSEQKSNYLEAEVIQYLGKWMPFRWEKAPHSFRLHMGPDAFVLMGDGSSEAAQAVIEQAYRGRAKEIFQARVSFFAERLGVGVNQIRVKSQKSRWGSCSSKGNLNFNWHAIVMPPEVVDYLVVHECCHLLQMNHSKDFWALVESLCPNYREYRKWLKDHDTQILP